MHNWRRLWEFPTKLWFSRDSRIGKTSEGRSGDHAESGSVGSFRETAIEGNPVNLAYINGGTVPKNHTDAGTVLVFENHIDEVTLIPKNHVDDETIHVRTGMLTEVQIPQKSDVPTTQPWTP